MTRILIPRASNISAKKVETSDWEKYFNTDIMQDYIVCGFTVTEQCPDILGVNVAAGNARVKGLHLNNSVSCTVNCLTACMTNKIYLNLCRNACCEADEWTFGSTVCCVPACGYHIANVVTACMTVTSICQGVSVRVNKNQFGFVGTGAQIAALCETYPGMEVFATNTASCFIIDRVYTRNAADTAWDRIDRSTSGEVYTPNNTTVADFCFPAVTAPTKAVETTTDCWVNTDRAQNQNFCNFASICNYTSSTYQNLILDFGSIECRFFHYDAEVNHSGGCGTSNGTIEGHYSTDNICYTLIDSTTLTGCGLESIQKASASVSSRYLRVRIRRDSGASNALDLRIIQMFEGDTCTYDQSDLAKAIDCCTATNYTGNWLPNADMRLDFTTVKLVDQILIHHDNYSSPTNYELHVGAADDGTTFDTKIRTFALSDLTDNANNFIRFNLQSKRYILLKAVDGRIVLNEIKFLEISPFGPHLHETIDPNDATLPLDGII